VERIPGRVRARKRIFRVKAPNDIAEMLLATAEKSAAWKKHLAQAKRATVKSPAVFNSVTPEAFAFVIALLLRADPRRTWILCSGIRSQELLFNDLENWHPGALFLPELEIAAVEGALADPEISAERLAALHRLAGPDSPDVIVLTADTLVDSVPSVENLKRDVLSIRKDDMLPLEELLGKLEAAGYERAPQVALRGQFAVRGGIVDVYSWQQSLPVRIEFFGDTIDSIRQFDPDAQTSVQPLDSADILGAVDANDALLRDYIGRGDRVIAVDVSEIDGVHVFLFPAPPEKRETGEAAAFYPNEIGSFEAGDFVIEEAKRMRFLKQLEQWHADKWQVAIFCHNEGELERLRDLLSDNGVSDGAVILTIGDVARGFTFPAAKIAVLSDAELFGRYRMPSARRMAARRTALQQARSQIDFSELEEGDLVVHLEQGIGKFRGLKKIPGTGGATQEVIDLEFADEARFYVPLEQAFLVSRYVGVGKKLPELSSLGDGKWSKARRNAEKAVYDYAARLLAVHAERLTAEGHAFGPDTKWQEEFERSFIYKETADQLRAIEATKRDMESPRPMDRLICGDVGFGKTEVAIRAIFKAVMGGKQAALLVPTTVLAQQHWQTLRERMSDYPIRVEMLSRFRTMAEQRAVIEGLRDGSVDVVVGTHRLISKDVEFRDLGLVVVDEEQRFGVAHKERLKQKFLLVDVLTLSATPIPRTLYLSLMGARDLSTIETPPPNRLPVETVVCGYDERVIRDAIRRELDRQGQVYFLHNRIKDIEHMRDRILHLVPKARAEIGHGQMDEDELENVMRRFVQGETNVLVSTTIIESGLDIPNANTIIINRADRFGLADLYQLRGRVGRAQHKAYAYLLLPREFSGAGDARRRVTAIKQYSSLGAGFKIAMRDLEIRGAGNILGTAQSGHATAIGFDLYCQLLRQAVAKLKGERVDERPETVVDADFLVTSEAAWLKSEDKVPAFLPVSYIEDSSVRIHAYRDVAGAARMEQVDKLRKEWRDRFGPVPPAAENLLIVAAIRITAARRKISRVEVRGEKLMLTRNADYIQIDGKFPRLGARKPEDKLPEILQTLRSLG
jgi:transcription-repair coupling factor (superfamily II helicase)